MKLLAYCVLKRPAGGFRTPPEVAGRTVRLVAVGPLAAVVSGLVAEPRPFVEEALAFEAVVEWFHAHCPAVIPVRFGSMFEDEASLRHALRRNATRYRSLLAALSGAVEIGIRVLASPPPAAPEVSVPAGSGSAWLEGRRRHYDLLDGVAAAWDALAAQIKTQLAGLFRRSCHDVHNGVLSVYFLVPRAQTHAFVRRARKASVAGAKLLISGPWPPHNFSAGSSAAA